MTLFFFFEEDILFLQRISQCAAFIPTAASLIQLKCYKYTIETRM